MTAGLKPYPNRRHSGNDWVGTVPGHWEVTRLARLGALSKGSGGNKDDEVPNGVPCVRYGDLYSLHQYFIHQSRSFVDRERSKDYTVIKFGDVLFAGSGETIEEIGKSAVNLMRTEALCGGDVILFRPSRALDAKFMGYATDCAPAATQKSKMGRGITVMHIYGVELKRMVLALPPLPEQAAIARFLDHMDRRIQRYIRAKERLIALLDEYKQALIHQAVTGQIDVRTGLPYEEYKESGVEWLGAVPASWEHKRIKFLLKEVDIRSTHGEETPLSMSQALGLVPSDMVERSLAAASHIGGRLCEEGDLVLNRLKAHLAVFALARQSGVVSPDYSVFRRRVPISMPFLELVLKTPALRKELRVRAKGIVEGFWRLYTGDFFDIVVPVPAEREQIKIVEHVSRIGSKTSALSENARHEIGLLNAFRARLIADVVTGKLDVREAAASLPDPDVLEATSRFDDP